MMTYEKALEILESAGVPDTALVLRVLDEAEPELKEKLLGDTGIIPGAEAQTVLKSLGTLRAPGGTDVFAPDGWYQRSPFVTSLDTLPEELVAEIQSDIVEQLIQAVE